MEASKLELPQIKNTGFVQVVDNPFAQGHKILLVTGVAAEDTERAASDFVFRYWRHAKEAITSRVGVQSDEYTSVKDKKQLSKANNGDFYEIVTLNEIKPGQKIKIVVYCFSEPPTPASEKQVWVMSEIGRTLIGTTNKAGELFHTFEMPGTFEISVDDNSQSKK